MKTTIISIILIVTLIGLLGILDMSSEKSTGAYSATTIKGTIVDKDGLQLYKNWRQSLSMIVATDQNDRIVGWGPLQTSKSYKLSLRSGWDYPLNIKLGYYDERRQERGELYNCTVLTAPTKDIVCDQFDSLVSQSSRSYR
jgi:hypothetical protein